MGNSETRDRFVYKQTLAVERGGFVPKYYEMDPETEELLPNGRVLVPGMRVICEDSDPRQEIDQTKGLREWWDSPVELERARRWNRWMTIESVAHEDDVVMFVGVYDDGTKKKFNLRWLIGWYVKKDTMAQPVYFQSLEKLEKEFDKQVEELRRESPHTGVQQAIADEERQTINIGHPHDH